MDDDDYYYDGRRRLYEAMMYSYYESMMREHLHNISPDLSPIRKRSYSPAEWRKGEIQVLPSERFKAKGVNYDELAEKNAQELIKEEQQAKLKAEKKKAKKERQKLKRKELNTTDSVAIDNSETIINKTSEKMDKLTLNSDKDTEELDMKAAFLSKAVKKIKNSSVVSQMPKQKKNIIDINSIINDALEHEQNNNYEEAVELFSEAINLAPRRFDLILKRSHLYYKLAKFEKSIQDSQTVLRFTPNNVDAHYRLGEAYFALNKLEEAERAYTKLLSLNSHRSESDQRLFSIRIKKLEGMGYHPNEAFTALLKSKNKTINEAIDFLTALENGKEKGEDLYYSDEDESEEFDDEEEEDDEDEDESKGAKGTLIIAPKKPTIIVDRKNKLCKDPSNPLNCCSLFVCNINKDITYQEMHNLFTKFGKIKSMRLISQPKCYAFVNYMESTSAGKAMEALQGCRWLDSKRPLIIKYPTNIINSSLNKLKDPEVIKKIVMPPLEVSSKPTVIKQPSVNNCPATAKSRPTPKTEECYFWRTNGCIRGNDCSNLHIPAHKSIDLYNKSFQN
uniref:Uncharacterized protein n=1 Tax=Cuerna arida TaxID=1464854 RepID=A0A1B6EZA7_9HEMI